MPIWPPVWWRRPTVRTFPEPTRLIPGRMSA
jgi:hypothetical protein